MSGIFTEITGKNKSNPTGEVTVLKQSLSYDIIVISYGASIDVKTIRGEDSELIISLPVNS